MLGALPTWPPFLLSKLTLDPKSFPASGSGLVPSGVLTLESTLVMLSPMLRRLDDRLCDGADGGAKDFPLPSILPPPSFRAAMAGVDTLRFRLAVSDDTVRVS